MKALISSAKIIDPKGQYHQQTKDILIENGVITRIEDKITAAPDTRIIELPGLHVSKGWNDMEVCFGEPGYEERETLENGLFTAARSGFTTVGVHPNTNPVTDHQAGVQFLKSKSGLHGVNLHPIGALTQGSSGVDLAELFDMKNSGAIAFGDYKKGVQNANLLKIALQYTQNFNGIVLSYPQENSIAGKGVVNEEVNATKLGLKGMPALAETLQIRRDLAILEYTGGSLHIPTVSTAESLDLIREAKTKGLNVSCSVAVHHLFFTDDVLHTFDSNFKVLPPLRNSKDVEALRMAVKDGLADYVTSDHCPMDIEHKKVEFEHAKYGTIGLESAFGALNAILPLDTVITALSSGASTFGIPVPELAPGQLANLTLFNPEEISVFSENNILSSSGNSAFLGSTLKGKVYGIIANHQITIS